MSFPSSVQLIRVGRWRFVLARVKNPFSFGVLLATVIDALRFAKQEHANLYVLLTKRPVNSAVRLLESGGTSMPAPAWWKSLAGWVAWVALQAVAGRPRRIGDVRVWLASGVSSVRRWRLKRQTRNARLSKAERAEIKSRLAALEREGGVGVLSRLAPHPDVPSVYDLRLDVVQLSAAPSPAARFPPPVAARAAREALSIGLSPGAAMVTLHVRESGFRPSLGLTERAADERRNAAVSSYRPAIDWLVAHGFTVVRIGDRAMTPFTHPGVIDLATHPARSDLLELWCIMQSRFYIGCDSGAIHAPLLTATPRLLVNAKDPILTYPGQPRDLYILKAVHDAATGRRLSLREMLTPGFLAGKNDFKRFDYRDNEPAEILEAVREMTEVVAAAAPPPPSPSQREYRQLLSEVIWTTIRVNREAGIDCGAWEPGADVLGTGWVARGFADRYLDLTVTKS